MPKIIDDTGEREVDQEEYVKWLEDKRKEIEKPNEKEINQEGVTSE